MIVSSFRRLLLASALVLSASTPALAVDTNARIKGSVTDPSGAVIPNVTITAKNVATGVVYTTTSQADGDYQFLQLPIGTYTVTATVNGFKSFSASGISLAIDQQYVEAIKMTLGDTSEKVEVAADAAQVDVSSMQLSNIVDASQFINYPLIGRDFTQLEQILPGVQASNDRFGTFSVNGSQSQQSSYLVNGADTNDFAINTVGILPDLDALSEFNLITSSLNAEYSRNSGGIVSTVIKTGTNQFHGDAYDFYRDTFLNNKNFFQQTAPVYHENIFGGTLGGPILKQKLFFFGAYEGQRARTPQTTAGAGSTTVFSAAQLSGDFSGSLANLSTNVIPGTIHIPGCISDVTTFAQCFPTGIVPTSVFNPIAVALVKKYVPQPNSAGGIFQFNPSTTRVRDQAIARIDYNLRDKNQFYFAGIYQHNPTANVLPFTGSSLPGFGDQNTSETRQLTGSFSHQFSASTLNELLVHYTRFNLGSVEPQATQLPSASGFAINPQDLTATSLPYIGISGYFNLGFSTNGPQPRVDQTYQIDDNVSKVIGHHSLKFGFDGRRFQVDNEFNNSNSGNFGFSTQGTFSSGDAGLDYLLGIPSTYAQGAGGRIDAKSYETYYYAQDTWKATQALTLNAGIGWQIDTAIHNRQFGGEGVNCFVPGQQSKIFPSAPLSLNFPGDPGCNDAQGATVPYKDFGPRIGFAYAPNLGFISGGAQQKLSIRGGYGIYYNRTEEEGSLQNLGDAPFGVNSAGVTDYVGGAVPAFANPYQDIDTGNITPNKFPAAFPKPGDKNVDFEQFGALFISAYSPGYRAPYAQNFNLTIERELPGRIIATASYVGSLGRHNQLTVEGNPITQAGHDACLASSKCSATAGRNNQATLYPSHTLYPQAIDPATGQTYFHGVGLISTEGTSNYNALELSARKANTHGFEGQFSYTYSHSLDDSSSFEGAGFGGERGFNQFNKALNYGNSDFDARHRLVLAPIYAVPFSKSGSAFSLRNLAGAGWQIGVIATFNTGFPFDIAYDGGTSRSLYCADGDFYYTCPDVPVQTAPLTRTDLRALTTKNGAHNFFDGHVGFAAEPLGSFGNIGRNVYHGPGTIRTDAQISKQFQYIGGDSAKYIETRIGIFNAFNHTNFHNPNGNYTSSTFGEVTAADAGRQFQLSGKIYF